MGGTTNEGNNFMSKKLDEKEIRERGEQLAQLQIDLNDLSVLRKSTNADFKVQRENLQEQIDKICYEIQTGFSRENQNQQPTT